MALSGAPLAAEIPRIWRVCVTTQVGPFGATGLRSLPHQKEAQQAGLQARLVEADFDVRAVFKVHGFDEADLALVEGKKHRRGSDAFAEEADALE